MAVAYVTDDREQLIGRSPATSALRARAYIQTCARLMHTFLYYIDEYVDF